MTRLNSRLVSLYATTSRFPSNNQQGVAEQFKMELTEPIESLTQARKLHHMKTGLPDKVFEQGCAERMQMAVIGGHGRHLPAQRLDAESPKRDVRNGQQDMAPLPENPGKFRQDTIRLDQMLDHLARNHQIKTLAGFRQDLAIEVDGVLPIEAFTSSESHSGQITTMNDHIRTIRSDRPCQSPVSAPYVQDLPRTKPLNHAADLIVPAHAVKCCRLGFPPVPFIVVTLTLACAGAIH
jgi:hypothetical protein